MNKSIFLILFLILIFTNNINSLLADDNSNGFETSSHQKVVTPLIENDKTDEIQLKKECTVPADADTHHEATERDVNNPEEETINKKDTNTVIKPVIDDNSNIQAGSSPSGLQFGQCNQDEVYSTSNMPEEIRNSSSSITVIDKNKIQLTDPVSLNDVLELVPGFNSYANGSVGNTSLFRIRGWNKSLMTLDGVRLNDSSTNAPQLNEYLPFGFDRIEVIRGPQSTIHGTQAQGGLVALFTEKGRGRPNIEFESGMGNNSTFRETLSFSGGNKDADYFLGITRLDTTGGSPTWPDGASVNDDYRNLTVASNVGIRLLKGKAEARNTFRFINAKKEIGLQYLGYPNYDTDQSAFNTDVFESFTFSHAPVSWYDYYVRFGLVKNRYKFFDPLSPRDAFDPFYIPIYSAYWRTDNTRLMLMTQHNLRLKKINTFTFGYELEYNDFQNIDGFDVKFDKDLTKNDVYFHDVINVKDILFLRGGCRITDSTLFGTYATPNVSGAIVLPTFKIPNSYSKIRSSYGYSLTEPTPFQLFNPLWGNTSLGPEKLTGWDVGFVESLFNDRVNLEFGYYNNKVKDLIQYDFLTNRFINTSRAKTRGWEASVTFKPIKEISATFNYTNTFGKQFNTFSNTWGDLIANPRDSFSYLVSYELKPGYTLFNKGYYSSSRQGYNRRTPGFFDMGLGFSAKLFEKKGFKVSVWGLLANILGEKYEPIEGYKMPGIHFMAGIRLSKSF